MFSLFNCRVFLAAHSQDPELLGGWAVSSFRCSANSAGTQPPSLATFETSREDLEDGADHEPSVGGGFGLYKVDAELDDSDYEAVNEDGTNHGHEPY